MLANSEAGNRQSTPSSSSLMHSIGSYYGVQPTVSMEGPLGAMNACAGFANSSVGSGDEVLIAHASSSEMQMGNTAAAAAVNAAPVFFDLSTATSCFTPSSSNTSMSMLDQQQQQQQQQQLPMAHHLLHHHASN